MFKSVWSPERSFAEQVNLKKSVFPIFLLFSIPKSNLLVYLHRIIFYRDGVGDGQLRVVVDTEVEAIKVRFTLMKRVSHRYLILFL